MSRLVRASLVLATLALAAGSLTAQPGPGAGPGASAPRAGMGPGHRMGPRFGPGVTPGWSLMTPEERAAHQKTMGAMHGADECHAYMDKHHEQMAERAKAQGQTMPGPRRDVCVGLQK